jgi:hypothetical protein
MVTTATRPRRATMLGFLLLIIGGCIMAGAYFDKGVTDLGDTRLTTPTETDSLGNPLPYCADLPQNDPRVIADRGREPGQPPIGCVRTKEALDKDGGISHPYWFTLGGVIFLIGICIITGIIWPRPTTHVNR